MDDWDDYDYDRCYECTGYGDEKIDKPGWIEWRKLLMEEKERRENADNN